MTFKVGTIVVFPAYLSKVTCPCCEPYCPDILFDEGGIYDSWESRLDDDYWWTEAHAFVRTQGGWHEVNGCVSSKATVTDWVMEGEIKDHYAFVAFEPSE